MNKEMLVQLAYQHIVPQPQRKYRANRRGLAMAAKQKKRAAALNILKYHDTSASQTYIMYVCMLLRCSLYCRGCLLCGKSTANSTIGGLIAQFSVVKIDETGCIKFSLGSFRLAEGECQN